MKSFRAIISTACATSVLALACDSDPVGTTNPPASHQAAVHWESPGIPAAITEIRGFASDDIHAVGASGAILHYDGKAWKFVSSPTREHLNGMWGLAPDNVVAVGSNGTILRFDGKGWHSENSGSTSMLYEVWGSAPDTLYAVGSPGTVLRYDGQLWSPVPPPPCVYLGRIWGTDGHNLYVGATDSLYHFDGVTWTNTHITVRSSVWGITGTARNDVWVTDGTNWPWHYNGVSWSSVYTQPNYPFTDLWSWAPDNIFGIGTDGFVSHYDGATWSEHSLGDYFLLSAWGVDENDVWVGGFFPRGTGGVLFHYDGTTWSQEGETLASGMRDVWSNPSGSRAFAVGWNGEALQKQDGAWRALDSTTSANLSAVWGAPTGEAIAVGDRGTFLRFDGASWHSIDLNTTLYFSDVWGASMADVYVGSYDGLWHLDGDIWKRDGFRDSVTSVWGTDGTNVYVAGIDSLYENNVVRHLGSTGWKTIYAEPGAGTSLLTGTTNGVVFAIFYDLGAGAASLRKYEGGTWEDLTLPVSEVNALAASDNLGLIIAADLGVFHLRDGKWVQMDPTYSTEFTGAWGGLDDVYLVGGSSIVRWY